MKALGVFVWLAVAVLGSWLSFAEWSGPLLIGGGVVVSIGFAAVGAVATVVEL